MRLKSPLEVYWSLTRRCNFRCSFCLMDAGEPLPGESAAMRRRLSKIITDAQPLKVVITGGEPTLVPELTEIIRELKKGGAFIELTTNGSSLTPEKLAQWRNAGLGRIQISINGSNPEINDPLMGAGTFRMIKKALEVTSQSGIICDVKITLLRQNFADLTTLLQLPELQNVRKIKIQEVAPMGRALHNFGRFTLTEEELQQMEEKIHHLAAEKKLNIDYGSLTLQYQKMGCAARCSIGDTALKTALLTETGELLPCTFSLVWGIKNNVLEKRFIGAWRFLEKLPEVLPPSEPQGFCATCAEKTVCGGGCRAISYALTARHNAAYQLCPKVKINMNSYKEASHGI